jgi:hypothetical protein
MNSNAIQTFCGSAQYSLVFVLTSVTFLQSHLVAYLKANSGCYKEIEREKEKGLGSLCT